MSVVLTLKAADGATSTLTLAEPNVSNTLIITTNWYEAGIFWKNTQTRIINTVIDYFYYTAY